ncbi:MAG: nucleoside triphosphate pyrophosphohydrolase [Brumimicrobium sp.]
MDERLVAFQRLLDIMDDLREKCPWDRKQTISSLRTHTIEETYELVDAIIANDMESLKGEIGDLMLHMVFYSKIASETGAFDITDVLNGICEKLITRHPHIYGDVEVKDEEDVKRNWEKIKLKEGNKSVLGGVPRSLPAMVKAIRIQEKVKGVGFDWETTEQVIEKVNEEWSELQQEVKERSDKIEDEFGDVLFSLINYARFINIDPETALEKTNKKFINRFQYMENTIRENNQSLSELNLTEMDKYWKQAKESER